MSRTYDENSMLKSKGIEYFPPVKNITDAFQIYKECGGMILSLEEDGFLVEEPVKIAKLYDISKEHLELYFRDALQYSTLSKEEIDKVITTWILEEDIDNLQV